MIVGFFPNVALVDTKKISGKYKQIKEYNKIIGKTKC